MGFLLLGVDSLIACFAISPMVSRNIFAPLALLFGVADGAGFLLGTALHWSIPENLSAILQTAILVVLGLYWIGAAVLSKKAAMAERASTSRWVWILPFALTLDNITFGLVDGVPAHASVWFSAGEQALSSALLAGVGLAVGMGVQRAVPALRQRRALASGVAGVAVIASAGVLLALG